MASKKYEGLSNIAKKKRSSKNTEKNDVVTPNTIMSAAVHDVYGDDDSKKLNMFMKLIVSTLSMLATQGEDSALFGKDFNDFFHLYVNTLNLCGKMKTILEDNGIDFDISRNGDD